MNKLQFFLKKKDIEISGKRYFIDAMSAMAMGLFSSLLVGTILRTVGQQLHITFLTDTIWPICRDMTGAAIGIAVAHSLKAHTFVLFSASIVGYAGNMFGGAVGAFYFGHCRYRAGETGFKRNKDRPHCDANGNHSFRKRNSRLFRAGRICLHV
nr:PTS sugar transporter subunit IIC [Treponema vincentii]